MTPEQQRIAIAEACGWKPDVRRAEIPEADFVHEETFWIKDGETKRGPWLPDYLSDLNAMHEAEKTLHKGFEMFYISALSQIVNGEPMKPSAKDLNIYKATAAQRAEAFLRTIGKWTE